METGRWAEAIRDFGALVEEEPNYGHPLHGSAAALLAQARQEQERAALPTPPAGKRPRPTDLPEEIKRRDRPKDLPA